MESTSKRSDSFSLTDLILWIVIFVLLGITVVQSNVKEKEFLIQVKGEKWITVCSIYGLRVNENLLSSPDLKIRVLEIEDEKIIREYIKGE